jgi:methylenetetrahydrofolate reductase (NADPH)
MRWSLKLTLILVHNDFHKSHGLFPLFDGLTVKNLDEPFEISESGDVDGVRFIEPETLPLTNGATNGH